MKTLTYLDLAENEIGDLGIIEIAKALKEFAIIEYLDISGNQIGKSSNALDVGDAIF